LRTLKRCGPPNFFIPRPNVVFPQRAKSRSSAPEPSCTAGALTPLPIFPRSASLIKKP
jgi:hypothetical protein